MKIVVAVNKSCNYTRFILKNIYRHISICLYERMMFMQIIKTIWDFIQDQVLGMQWLNGVIAKLLGLVG